MCGRGATSACAASGRTNVVTRIAATCPFTPAAPRRGDAPVLCPKCSSSAAKARDRRTRGWRYAPSPRSPWRIGRRMGVGDRGSVMLEHTPPPRGLDHVPTAPSDGRGGRPAGSCGRMEVPTNHLEEGSSASRAAAAGASHEASGLESAKAAGAGGVASSAAAREPRASRRRRRFAGGERGSRPSQGALNIHCGRVRATKYAPRGPSDPYR